MADPRKRLRLKQEPGISGGPVSTGPPIERCDPLNGRRAGPGPGDRESKSRDRSCVLRGRTRSGDGIGMSLATVVAPLADVGPEVVGVHRGGPGREGGTGLSQSPSQDGLA